MNKCIHADEMMEYAKDAQVMDKPWKLWQFTFAERCREDGWEDLREHPSWSSTVRYRRKPRAININGHKVPEPVQTPPANHAKYYIPDIKFPELYDAPYWERDTIDYYRLESGLVHLTKDAAVAHAKALLSFTAKSEVSDE